HVKPEGEAKELHGRRAKMAAQGMKSAHRGSSDRHGSPIVAMNRVSRTHHEYAPRSYLGHLWIGHARNRNALRATRIDILHLPARWPAADSGPLSATGHPAAGRIVRSMRSGNTPSTVTFTRVLK